MSGDVEEARTIQRLVAGLDAHLRTLALVERLRAPDADAPDLTARERVDPRPGGGGMHG